MTFKLFIGAAIKFLLGVLLVGMLLFLPAWTLDYPTAWLLMGILFVPMLIAGIVLMLKNPTLLEKRLNSKERDGEQQLVVKLSGFMFVIGFAAAALDFRFGWLCLPRSVSYTAAVVLLIAYAMYAEVMRENAYLSRTVEIQGEQKVVDTGLYGIVRHPMYSSTLLLFLSIPMVLGSGVSLAIFLVYPFLIARRIKNEESFLETNLCGYSEYKKKVKYKMIPLVW